MVDDQALDTFSTFLFWHGLMVHDIVWQCFIKTRTNSHWIFAMGEVYSETTGKIQLERCTSLFSRRIVLLSMFEIRSSPHRKVISRSPQWAMERQETPRRQSLWELVRRLGLFSQHTEITWKFLSSQRRKISSKGAQMEIRAITRVAVIQLLPQLWGKGKILNIKL